MTSVKRQLHLFKSKSQRGVVVDYAPSEFQLHCAIADTVKRWISPNWIFSHIPLGEERPATAGARLKRLGTQPGWPDLIFLPPREHQGSPRAHFLELKRPGAKLTEHQAGFALWCQLNNYPHAVTSDYRTAVRILQAWGALRSGINVQ